MNENTMETGEDTSTSVETTENVETTETPDAVELAEDLTIEDLLGLSVEDDELFTDDANHKGMKPLHQWVQHLPEDVRKHIGNLRASYTRKTQELANLRKELEAERDAMVSQRQQTMNNPAYQKAVELANSEEQFDLYDPEGMKREIERQAAIQLKQMLEPAREQIKMEQRKVELQRFKDQNPELMDDAYRLPIAKMLHERPELRLEDAFYIVKAKVGAEKLEAEKRQMEAQRASRRETLKKTSTGANASPKGSPKFKDAWAAYQYHKAQQDKM